MKRVWAILRFFTQFGFIVFTYLESQGWQLLRINGSHHIYGKSDNPARISVPIHGNQSLKPGLLRHFLKVANLSEDDI